jgi:hypothetical protein
MRAAALAALTAALLTASPAGAAPPGKSRVSLDWRSVRDADIERCGLLRLRAGTLEQLVDDGHAVVDGSDATIRVRVASVPEGLEVRVESLQARREDTLRLPEDCDATLVLEAISRIADLVRRVQAEAPVAPPVAPEAAAPREEPVEHDAAAHFRLTLDLTARAANPNDFLLVGGGAGGEWGSSEAFRLGARADLAGNARHDVTVFEASAALTGGWQPGRSGFGLGLELGPILHLGRSEQLSVSELDAAGAAGVTFSAGLFRAQLMAYVRLRRFEHHIDGQTAFDTGQAGLILRIGVQLFDS